MEGISLCIPAELLANSDVDVYRVLLRTALLQELVGGLREAPLIEQTRSPPRHTEVEQSIPPKAYTTNLTRALFFWNHTKSQRFLFINSISQMRQRCRLGIKACSANYWRGVLLILFVMLTLTWLIYLLDVPFHEDEAIYAAWSLRIVRGDPWLWVTPVDKPPLTFYPIALSIALFGRHEWAARLPNLLWTGLLLAMLWRIAKRQGAYDWLAIRLPLFTPLLWAQAASAFTDAAMVALAFLAVERGMSGRATQAGVAFGFAFLAKPTALFLAPLVVTTLICSNDPERRRRVVTTLSDFLMACAAPLLLAWAWDASRAAPSWWALGSQAYGTLGKIGIGQIEEWIRLTSFSLGPLFLVGMMDWTRSNALDHTKWPKRLKSFLQLVAPGCNWTRSNDVRLQLANAQVSVLEVNSAENTVNSSQNEAKSAQNGDNSAESPVNSPQNNKGTPERGRPFLRDTKRKKFERSPRASFSRSMSRSQV